MQYLDVSKPLFYYSKTAKKSIFLRNPRNNQKTPTPQTPQINFENPNFEAKATIPPIPDRM